MLIKEKSKISPYAYEKTKLMRKGFRCFTSLNEIIKSNFNMIPEQMGVYLILSKNQNIRFLDNSEGGRFKGKNPVVLTDRLKENWVFQSSMLYIGKAGGPKSNSTLKKRIKQYLFFGCGKPVGHWGGRFIWQIKDNKKLILSYKTLNKTDPRNLEKLMIAKFFKKYGRLPFANLCR